MLRYHQVLDTARVFPPGRVHRVATSLVIPASEALALDITAPIPKQGAGAPTAVRRVFVAALEAEADVTRDEAGADDGAARGSDDRPVVDPSAVAWRVVPCGGGVMCVLRPVPGVELAPNPRASHVAGRTVCGPALWLHTHKGEHLFRLLRPELVATSATALVSSLASPCSPPRFGSPRGVLVAGVQSSDAFTGFGRINARKHNTEVAAAEQRLDAEARLQHVVGLVQLLVGCG